MSPVNELPVLDRKGSVLDCQGCGVCCLHMGYPAFNLTLEQLLTLDQSLVAGKMAGMRLSPVAVADLERWRGMPSELQQQVLELMRTYRSPENGELDGPCSWLDGTSQLCSHHQHRPQVCRDFRVGGEGCLEWRKSYSVV